MGHKQNAINRYNTVHDLLLDDEIKSSVTEFIYKFLVCEMLYKGALADYKKSRNEDYTYKNLKLNMNVIPKALEFSGIFTDNDILHIIFASKTARNSKSAKDLRDGLFHKINPEDISEIFVRRNELLPAMSHFIDLF